MGLRSDQLGVWFMFILLSPWVSMANFIDEGDALLTFKSGLKDPNNALYSWGSPPYSDDPCTWDHITCVGSISVIRIDIMNLGLSGPLSGSLGMLKNLQYLVLYKNNFYGNIPPELGNLAKLVSLDLSSNSLTGPIPAELGKLYNLQFLYLYRNKFNGKIPPQLGNLANLLIFDLHSNHLTGPIPREMGKLQKLTIIRLQNNNLCGYPPPLHPTVVLVRPGNPLMCVPFDCKPCKGPLCCK